MKLKASLFSYFYGIGFRIARRWVIDHERPRSEITNAKLQITERKPQITNLKSERSASSQGWATVYGVQGRWDTMQSLGDAGYAAGPVRHTRRQDDGGGDEVTEFAPTGDD